MGILRVDKLSGLETPTAITSSVYFDGDARNDNLNFGGDPPDLDFQNTDFTFESWVYPTDMSSDRYWCSKGDGNLPGTAMDVRFDSDGQIRINFYVSSTAYSLHTGSRALQENVWSHVAVVRSGTSFKSYVNGKETSSATHDITISDVSATFKIGILEGVGTGFKGYMSDFRFVRGKAVYTEEFTPPVYALEPIDGTVLLCCNNPDSAGADGTGKTITVNGDVSIASTNPGSLKDFTYGTEFKGVTTFDTQGYFVPPSGTTAQRGRGRGIFGGGSSTPSNREITIDFIEISTQGNALEFGDLTDQREKLAGAGGAIRGLFAGGDVSPTTNIIDFVTIASTGNAIDFGDTTNTRQDIGGAANTTRAIFFAGGGSNIIDYVTIASLGDAQDFGDLSGTSNNACGCGSPTRGIIFAAVGASSKNIEYITWATTGNSVFFGVQSISGGDRMACSDSTRGIVAGGYSSPNYQNIIEFITIASLGNSQDFGDLTEIRFEPQGATSNSIRGVFAGGEGPGDNTNTIDYVTIQSTGNAQDFGDMTLRRRLGSACSDSHGGIS